MAGLQRIQNRAQSEDRAVPERVEGARFYRFRIPAYGGKPTSVTSEASAYVAGEAESCLGRALDSSNIAQDNDFPPIEEKHYLKRVLMPRIQPLRSNS